MSFILSFIAVLAMAAGVFFCVWMEVMGITYAFSGQWIEILVCYIIVISLRNVFPVFFLWGKMVASVFGLYWLFFVCDLNIYYTVVGVIAQSVTLLLFPRVFAKNVN